MNDGQTRLSHLALMTGLARRALTYRAHELFEKKEIKRAPGNHILLEPHQTYKLIEDQFIHKKGKIIYIGMPKGGVGKSFISFFITLMAKSLGLKVCTIDLDDGNNFTRQILERGNNELPIDTPVFVDIISDHKHPELGKKLNIQDLIMPISSNFDLIPSTSKNTLIQQTIVSQKPKHLEHWLNDLCLGYLRENYDVIIIDSGGKTNTLLSSIGVCLDERDNVLIPALADAGSYYHLGTIINDIYMIRDEYRKNSELNIKILINKKPTNRLSEDDFESKIHREYGGFLLRECIPDSALLTSIYNKPSLLNSLKEPKKFYDYLSFLLTRLEILKSA